MPNLRGASASRSRSQQQSGRWSRCFAVGAVGALGALGAVFGGCSSSRDQQSAATLSETGAVTSLVAAPDNTPAPANTVATALPTTLPGTTAAAEPTTTTSPPTTTTSPPTTTTEPLVTEGAVVRVANATDVPGAAGRLTNELADVGYQVADPTNSAGNEEELDATKVYFLPAGEAVATGLAELLGVPLARMPTPAPIVDATAGLREATVLVMLGEDLAGTTPPGLSGR